MQQSGVSEKYVQFILNWWVGIQWLRDDYGEGGLGSKGKGGNPPEAEGIVVENGVISEFMALFLVTQFSKIKK